MYLSEDLSSGAINACVRLGSTTILQTTCNNAAIIDPPDYLAKLMHFVNYCNSVAD